MDKVLRGMMNITEEQAESDSAKVKAMRTCVGWFSSPACALIYQVRLSWHTPAHLSTPALTRMLHPAPAASGVQVRGASLQQGLRHRPKFFRVA